VAVLGFVQGGFPALAAPRISFEDGLHLLSLAFVVALVVMVQTAATSRAFSGAGQDPDINRDYIGLGVANMLSGLVGGFPANASPPRTAIVAEAGGQSQYGGLSAALAVLLLAAFGTRILVYVPTAALAGILLFVAVRIFHVATFSEILRRSSAEFALALLTTVLIVALPIQSGVGIGMFLSLVHGVFTTTRAKPIAFERVADTTVWWPASKADPGETQGDVVVMGFQAPLSFLNAYDFRRGILAAIARDKGVARLLVLEASSIVEIDFTASKILSEVIARARTEGMDFAVARLESVRAQAAFQRFGITDLLGQDHIFQSVDAAIRRLAGSPGPGEKVSG
jgi:MFS superfamily sulfate permease-like transporter